MTEKLKLQLPTIITLACILCGIVASYFQAIADGKAYVDQKVAMVQAETKIDLKDIKDKQEKQGIDLAVIKSILIKRYGIPRHD